MGLGGNRLSSENTFQERAEKLTKEEVRNWVALTEKDEQIIKKLQSNSTKLLIGPRGTGKSMLMRWAYYSCFEGDDIFPVYVNFEKYLTLEPLLHETSNGNVTFRKWILAKIIVETIPSLEEINEYNENEFESTLKKFFSVGMTDIQKIAYQFEGGTLSDYSFFESLGDINFSVGSVLDFITYLVKNSNRKRAILLLDDAAHAFSSNLQKEFFEIFRILKTKEISAKAAVYPGLTSYSPYFNVGHDALYLEAGYSPETPDYIGFCDNLLRKRLGNEYYEKLAANSDGLHALYYAANGIPRGIIVMTEYLLEDYKDRKITTTAYYEAIDIWVEIIEKFHSSLKTRLPRYTKFIDAGTEFLQIALGMIKDFNKDKPIDKKAVFFALSNPVPNELEKMINILEYAGLVTQKKDISKGVKGVFTRYLVHLGKIIQFHALAEGKTKTLAYTNDCLRRIRTKQFKRIRCEKIFKEDIKIKCAFELPPCHNCGKARISEDAKFCAYCGEELKIASIYYEIIEQDIDALPLTQKQLEKIKYGSKIRTIKDILMDENGVEIKKVKGIKGYWAERIKSYAEEFVGG